MMILRLVCSFFFFSLATGNQRGHNGYPAGHGLINAKPVLRTNPQSRIETMSYDVENLSDEDPGLQGHSGYPAEHGLINAKPVLPTNPQSRLQTMSYDVENLSDEDPGLQGYNGYPAGHDLINAKPVLPANPQSRIETMSYDVENLSDEDPGLQAPRLVQYVEEERENGERTICFTPLMVHRTIKTVLEFVRQIPSYINDIIALLDQEINKMSDQEHTEDDAVKKPLYPLDSKTIFQMLDKPKSESRTNFILKYELPSENKPQCREALEKLIEIAYIAYLELEQHPQCRDYLYDFATHQPEDRPSGHLDQSPDLKSLIAIILKKINKRKPNLHHTPGDDRYGGMEIPELLSEYNNHQKPQIVEYNINENNFPYAQELNKPALILPKPHEYTNPQNYEYNVPKFQEYTITESHEYPKVLEYFITENHEYDVPKNHENNIPNAQEFNKPALILPKPHEYINPQNHEYNVPKFQEYTITESHEYPKVLEYTITENHEYDVPKHHENNIPNAQEPPALILSKPQENTITQNHEYNVPKVQEYTIIENHEYNIPKVLEYIITENHEYYVPKNHKYNINEYSGPEVSDFDVPQFPEYNIDEYNVHNAQELNKPPLILPKPHEYTSPQNHEYNVPKFQEYTITESHEYPKVLENIITENHKYDVPQNHENNIPNAQEFNKPALILPKPHEYTNPQNHEYNVPKLQEYTITESHEYPKVLEYTITENHKYDLPKNHENNIPNAPELNKPSVNLPKPHEYDVPTIKEYIITENHEYPKVLEYTITENHKYDVPKNHENNIPSAQELNKPSLNLPKPHEYHVPKIKEYIITENHVPQIKEFTITETHEYPTKVHEYNIPQIQDIIRPPVQYIDMPESHETIHETIEVKPMQPEETIYNLIKILQTSDHPDSGNWSDRIMDIVQENPNNFHPKILETSLALLRAHEQNKIHRFNDLFSLLLDSQRNRDWPWNDRITDNLLSHLIPDQNDNLDSRIIEIILNLYKKRPNEKHIEYILSLLRPLKEGKLDNRVRDLILKLIHLHQNTLLHPDHVDILAKLLKPSHNGYLKPKEIDVADLLTTLNEMGIIPNQLNGLFALLKPYVNGYPDTRLIDIIHFLSTKSSNLNPRLLNFTLSFLFPENGVLDTRRIAIMHFLLKNVTLYPKQTNILLTLLRENTPAVLNSVFLDILLLLDAHNSLTPALVEVLINITKNDVTGQLEDNQVETLFLQLAPFKKSNPKLLMDVLTHLNGGGLDDNLIDWFESATDRYQTPDGGFQVMDAENQLPDHDFVSILQWLQSQGLITQNQGSNTDLVNKILNILKVGEQQLGVVELTYMLKHEKPLIYQPVYYVKYRLPILSFISNMKNLLQENPNLNADPMKLLQELIVISNVTEVSPNLQGFPKDEILKLTFNDGDLVQAKILDEQNLSLNDQISYVHGLNSDISPEEILQLNIMNEAKYFPNLKEVKGVRPDQLTVKDVDQFIDIPPVHYMHVEMNPGIVGSHPTKTIVDSYNIARKNHNQDALNDNAQI